MNALTIAPDSKWIQTYTGKAFWPLNPRVQDVCIEDIAHALSMKCRYTGHCKRFYSVAEHSILARFIVPKQDRLWALLHDAAEAYLPDVARPIKKALIGFQQVEDRIIEVIAEVFGLTLPMPESIKQADLILLATEQRDLMASAPYEWCSTKGIEPLPSSIRGMTPDAARSLFLMEFQHLQEEKPVRAVAQ